MTLRSALRLREKGIMHTLLNVVVTENTRMYLFTKDGIGSGRGNVGGRGVHLDAGWGAGWLALGNALVLITVDGLRGRGGDASRLACWLALRGALVSHDWSRGGGSDAGWLAGRLTLGDALITHDGSGSRDDHGSLSSCDARGSACRGALGNTLERERESHTILKGEGRLAS